jgi:thioredoxin 1
MTFLAWALGIVLLLIGGMQAMVFARARRMRGKKIEAPAGATGSAMRGGERELFYCYRPGCSACHAVTPVIQALQQEHANVQMVNTAEDMALARALGVMATPTVVLIDAGTVREFIVGARPASTFRALLAVP